MATVATRLSLAGGVNLATDGSAEFEPAVVAAPASVSVGEKTSAALVIDSAVVTGTEVAVEQRSVSKPYQRHRIVVGGKDVTYFRGVQTPMPSYGLVSPLLYGTGAITFPQIHAQYERPGHGELTWLRKWSPVKVQRVDADDNVVATDYRGFVSDFTHQGPTLSCTLGGQAEGDATLQDRPNPIFPRPIDIGAQGIRTVRQRLRLPTGAEPETGIVLMESGGDSQIAFLTDLLAKSVMRDGTQWTIMPNSSGVYHMFQKDLETIGLTLYTDDTRVVASLIRDFAEEPNRVWAHAVDEDGMRLRPANLPGMTLEDPPSFPGTMSPGDDGTAAFEKVRWRLWATTYLDGSPPVDVWTTDGDDPVTQAIKDLQDDAGLSQTGVINSATWDALFDPLETAGSLRGAAEKPAAQRSYTKPYLRSASGRVLRHNPNFDRSRKIVDLTVDDMGVLKGQRQLYNFARRELADENTANWVGTITIYTGAVIDGEHNPGDPLDDTGIREARSVKPGQNVWLPNWDGGALVHVSGVEVNADSVQLLVDTRGRDTMKAWEIRSRNRAAKRNPARNRIAQNRRSGLQDNTGAWYDGGVFGRTPPRDCVGDGWTVFPVWAGRSGLIQKIDIQTDVAAEFAFQLWAREVDASWCNRKQGNPLADGFKEFLDAHVDDWQDNRGLINHWGTNLQPCGYGSREHTNSDGETTDAPLTGRFVLRDPMPYWCIGQPRLWVAFYGDRDTTVEGGRILTLLLDDSAG